MPTFTISIPKELKKKMNQYPEINWPEVVKNRLQKRAETLLQFEQNRKKTGG